MQRMNRLGGVRHPRRMQVERLEDRCLLSADVAASPVLQVRLQIVDLSGQPADQVTVGSEYMLQLLVRDLRDGQDAKGAFSAFADITFRPERTSPSSDPRVMMMAAESFYNVARYVNTSRVGLLDEVGAVSDSVYPLGNDELLVTQFRFRADSIGLARFGLDPADDDLNHPMLAYGLDTNVDTVYLGTQVQITGPHGETIADDGWLPSVDLGVEVQPREAAPCDSATSYYNEEHDSDVVEWEDLGNIELVTMDEPDFLNHWAWQVVHGKAIVSIEDLDGVSAGTRFDLTSVSPSKDPSGDSLIALPSFHLPKFQFHVRSHRPIGMIDDHGSLAKTNAPEPSSPLRALHVDAAMQSWRKPVDLAVRDNPIVSSVRDDIDPI